MSAPPPEAVRVSARVLLLDPEGRVFLLCGRDPAEPARRHFWFTPGGGVEDGEPPAAAAARELREETGMDVAPESLGEAVAQEDARYRFNGRAYRQTGLIYALRCAADAPRLNTEGWTELEARSLTGARWWDPGDLAASGEDYFPRDLPDLVRRLAARPPD